MTPWISIIGYIVFVWLIWNIEDYIIWSREVEEVEE